YEYIYKEEIQKNKAEYVRKIVESIDKGFRIQAKRAFEAARQTGRKVYFHFNGEPCRDIIRKLQEYQRRYGIEMIIDTEILY
ncbi:MAG TPA: restriction endonuclease fold toxin, partial [Candidatus Dependentiae bacterium]|nr:restriction endonuclease fold toxin [Candidatus Dependentiae bacterium]